MGVYKSGAFLQQCFSVHPLTLHLKVVTPPELVGIFCTNCRMKHRVTVKPTKAQEGAKPSDHDTEMQALHQCCSAHSEDVRISLVDVVKGSVELRCHPCRRTYVLGVELIETHQS